MKKCTWCGKEYADDAQQCAVDGQPLAGGEPIAKPALEPAGPPEPWRAQFIDLLEVNGAFTRVEGYIRPDWKGIGEAIDAQVAPGDRGVAWTEAARKWAEQVQSDLGGEYQVRCSERFLLLSERDPEAADQLLRFAESSLDRIEDVLREAAWKTGLGKHVVFLFTEDDDYYQYVSYFYRDGVHPASAGCLIHKGYVHIAMPCLDGHHIRSALAHELAHNCVVHLPLPLWLNEGLAVTFARTAAEWRGPIVDHDLRDRHLAFWNATNIQRFWSGISFGEPGEPNELSYSLAEILMNLLLEEREQFGAFVAKANWADAGQTAALDYLNSDLGQTLATFLGEGHWRPSRKAMVECWDAAKKAEGQP